MTCPTRNAAGCNRFRVSCCSAALCEAPCSGDVFVEVIVVDRFAVELLAQDDVSAPIRYL